MSTVAEKEFLGEVPELDTSSTTTAADFRFVIVTGMSGGGKTQACRYLEDLGYFVIDNLPPVFIPKFVELAKRSGGHVGKVVLVVDTRSREFFDRFVQILDDMDRDDLPYEVLFMDASDACIIRRYKETRRRHPMAPSSRISDGIAKERERLSPARAKATYIIDTSELKKVELRDKIHRIFGNSDGEQMSINVLSFGFKFGMPLDADMVLDVRFLPNPYYIPELRSKTGLMPEVRDYVFGYQQTVDYFARLEELLGFTLPLYFDEGKTSLVIAVGCTGGAHRSVAIAEAIAQYLRKQGLPTEVTHRDLPLEQARWNLPVSEE